MRATNLTRQEIDSLRERAKREAGPFVDPRLVNRIEIYNSEWASEILGFPFEGSSRLPWSILYLLHLASRAEPAPPPPPVATARQLAMKEERWHRERLAKEEADRRRNEWCYLAAALGKAGAKIEVRHNYTSRRHLDGFTQGADHIFLLESFRFGRLCREGNVALCWTPSRAKGLQHFPNEPDNPEDPPTCKACLKVARSVAKKIAFGADGSDDL